MSRSKVCPLKFNADREHCFCDKEECAWWDDVDGQCASLILADIARALFEGKKLL